MVQVESLINTMTHDSAFLRKSSLPTRCQTSEREFFKAPVMASQEETQEPLGCQKELDDNEEVSTTMVSTSDVNTEDGDGVEDVVGLDEQGDSSLGSNLPSISRDQNDTCQSLDITTDIFSDFDESVGECGIGRTFLCGPILPPSGNLVSAVILSAWDNIIGPKAIFVWTQRAEGMTENVVLQEAIVYTVGHTLHGELEKMNVGSTVARGTELYVVEDRGFIVCSMPFSVLRKQDSVPHSLSFIIPFNEMKSFIDMNPLFTLWMQRLACCLAGCLCHKDYKMVVKELSPEIVEFCHLLESMSSSGLMRAKRQITIDVEIERQFLKPILKNAITSHLQTCCCSVVVGDSLEAVNYVVCILAQFLRPQETALVRLALERDISWSYQPGLLIQGMLKGIHGEVNIATEDILRNLYPTTIIDLSQIEVRRSWLLHEHLRHRTARLKQEWAAMRTNSKPIPTMTQYIFKRESEVSPLVHEFMEKLWSLEFDVERRQNLVTLFLRRLEHVAFALIKLWQSAMAKGQNLLIKKSIRQQLDLENDADFLIVVAVAERLQPGIYPIMMQGSTSVESETGFR